MKTTELIDCLTNKELKIFSAVMQNTERTFTRKLFFQLSKRPSNKEGKLPKQEPMTTATIFEAVFDTAYEPSKDYLLRNEYRLLNQALEKFIAQNAMPKEDEKYYYLQSILRKGRHELFHKEVKKEINKRMSAGDYEGLVRLNQLLLDKNLSMKALKKPHLDENIALCEQIQFFQNKTHYYRLAELNTVLSYLKKNVQILGFTVSPPSPFSVPQLYQDNYLEYLECKAEGFFEIGAGKKEKLQKTLKLLDEISYFKLDKEQAKMTALNNLALEYLLSFEYQNAVEAFEQLQDNKKIPRTIQPLIQFNYLVCLLKNEQFSEAILLMESAFSATMKVPAPIAGKINAIKAMAWIFVGDLDKAFEALPLNLKEGARTDYFYTRLVFSIIYFLEGNVDLAHREIDNLLQILDENKDFMAIRFCTLSLRKYYSFSHQSKKMKALAMAIDDFINPAQAKSDVLPLLWLRSRLAF